MNDYEDEEDEEDRRHFHEFLARLEADHQARIISLAEESLATDDHTEFPMPNTSHPGLASKADFVLRTAFEDRYKLGKVRRFIQLLIPRKVEFSEEKAYPTSIDNDRLILESKRLIAPMPFVGDARYEDCRYLWTVWLDKYGRWIAEDSYIRREPKYEHR